MRLPCLFSLMKNHYLRLGNATKTCWRAHLKSTINAAAAGGSILSKSWRKATNLFVELAASDYEWPSVWQQPRRVAIVGLLEVDALTQINAQLAALNKKINTMNYCGQSCKHCVGNHANSSCLTSSFVQPRVDQENYVNYNKQQSNPFSNTYNPGWRNHPNFSWKKE